MYYLRTLLKVSVSKYAVTKIVVVVAYVSLINCFRNVSKTIIWPVMSQPSLLFPTKKTSKNPSNHHDLDFFTAANRMDQLLSAFKDIID